MKKLFLSFVAMTLLSTINAQVPNTYKVATWHDFKESAITYSFDDGTKNQIPVAIPILEKYGYKATFNLVTNWVSNWSEWKSVAEKGHEIASHTISHPNFSQISEEQQRVELEESKKIIEKEIGKECITMVYPYCVRGNDNIVAEYYISARTCSGAACSASPTNLFDISSKLVGSECPIFSAMHFNNWVSESAKKNAWSIFLLHGIDNDGGYSPVTADNFEQHIKFVKESEPLFWVATFAEISKYIIERNALTITETAKGNKYEIVVGLSTQSKITKLDQPITISRDIPKKVKKVKVSCNGAEVPSRISNGTIIFDVVPGNNYTMVF